MMVEHRLLALSLLLSLFLLADSHSHQPENCIFIKYDIKVQIDNTHEMQQCSEGERLDIGLEINNIVYQLLQDDPEISEVETSICPIPNYDGTYASAKNYYFTKGEGAGASFSSSGDESEDIEGDDDERDEPSQETEASDTVIDIVMDNLEKSPPDTYDEGDGRAADDLLQDPADYTVDDDTFFDDDLDNGRRMLRRELDSPPSEASPIYRQLRGKGHFVYRGGGTCNYCPKDNYDARRELYWKWIVDDDTTATTTALLSDLEGYLSQGVAWHLETLYQNKPGHCLEGVQMNLWVYLDDDQLLPGLAKKILCQMHLSTLSAMYGGGESD